MSASIRTLKLNLLGDVSGFNKSMRKASGDADNFSSKMKSSMKSIGKSVALAGVAAAGFAVAFGTDAVKAYLEDEKGQRRLQTALKNTTKATTKQRKAVETYISKVQYAYGVTDDKLRPAFQRLTQATGSIAKSQSMFTTVLDISAGTGKDVETVANALAKAYGGNLASLQRLGLGLDKATIKSGNFDVAFQKLQSTFGGQAKAKANSFEGRLEILKIRFDEFKESVGGKLITPLTTLMNFVENTLVPRLGDVADGFNGKTGVNKGVKDFAEIVAAQNLGLAIRNVASAFGALFTVFAGDKKFSKKGANTADTLQSIADAINAIAGALRTLKPLMSVAKTLLDVMPNLTNVDRFKDFFLHGKPMTSTKTKKAVGGAVSRGRSYLVGERGAEVVTMGANGYITPNNRLGGNGGTTIININGVIDAESARRSIERLLQTSSIRTGAINLRGSVL